MCSDDEKKTSELGVGGTVLRGLLIGINAFFAILGIIAAAIGIWAIIEDQNFTAITGDDIITGGGIVIAAGIFTLVIAVIGIMGSIHKARPMLIIYAAVMVLVIILEVAAAIAAFVFRDRLLGIVRERTLEAIASYSVNEPSNAFNTAVENIQNLHPVVEDFGCCGFDNASDWITQNPVVVRTLGTPPGCIACSDPGVGACTNYVNVTLGINFNTTDVGCGDFLNANLSLYTYAVAAIALVFAILEVGGVVIAFVLFGKISKSLKEQDD